MPACSAETMNWPSARENGRDGRPATRETNPYADFQAIAKTVRNLQDAIGLTSKESLILKYLIVNPDRYVDDRQIAALAFGLFDRHCGPAAVREHVASIKSKYLNEFGFDPIQCDPERGYMFLSRAGVGGYGDDESVSL